MLEHLGILEASLVGQLCAPDGFLGQGHRHVRFLTPVFTYTMSLLKQHLGLQHGHDGARPQSSADFPLK